MYHSWERVPFTGSRRHFFLDAGLRTSWRADRASGTLTYSGREMIQTFDDEETCLSTAYARTRVVYPLPPPDMLTDDGASSSRGPRFIRTRVIPRGRARGVHSAPLLRPRAGRRYATRPTERLVTRIEVDLASPTVDLEETGTDTSLPVTEEDPSEAQGEDAVSDE